MLLESDDYRQFITWARRLETEGHLQTILTNMVELFDQTDIISLSTGSSRGPSGLNELVRESWNKVWPDGLNVTERNRGFSLTMAFWRRLDQTRLFEKVMLDVLPATAKEGSVQQQQDAIDTGRVLSDSEEQRVAFFEGKLGQSPIVKQYVKQSEGDDDVKALTPVVMPFFFKYLRSFELKLASQTVDNEGWQSIGFIGLLLVALVATVQLGFGSVSDDESMPGRTKMMVDRRLPQQLSEAEINKLAAREEERRAACEAGDASACPERPPTVEELQRKNAGKSAAAPAPRAAKPKGPAALDLPRPEEEEAEDAPDLRSPAEMAKDQLSTVPRVGIIGGLSGQFGASGPR